MNRFSLNHATTKHWDVFEAVEACARAEIGIGLWREPVADKGLEATAARVRDSGVTVTSLCRGGFLTTGTREALDDNRRAIDEAATLGTSELVMVCGGLPSGSRDLDAARETVAEAIAELAPHAAASGVRLAIEPLHPMFASDRCVISTLDQALDLAERFPATTVGVVVDTYHIWWDPTVWSAIERARGRISSFQVADWSTPLPAGVLTGRAQLGDGVIDLRRFRHAADAAGYDGLVEVEIFNDALWARPGAEVLAETLKRYAEHVA
ncbi:sugar phosphate isomerase/epimerase family protein [Stackebrandtia nassauensis]|uniref:Xylose isomerase domain protein TIM barrel n=1 Tax=Stackebrandtia nassauensis (strain DSM 44728 / CIP 108903 / NRRL B-16338 / NBRC 102104 / LLR-40K-21) TaxID=446470 RepID=D3QA77_STANL|nr:sugar phosphate isomerase/epimerase family protein [Stackebrandtia nassauensis]ADD40789.1 Xylose isomerase domain protein TIM barrel [Stackebrandtia nassauensis DSM 44728]